MKGLTRNMRPGGDRIGTGRFETFLRKLLSVKGVIAPDVEGIMATLSVDDLIPEHLYLRGTRLGAGWASAAAGGAGTFAEVSISPPVLTPQPTLYVVDRICLQTDAVSAVRVNVGPALPGATVAGDRFTRDERWGVASAPTLTVLSGTNIGQALTADYLQLVIEANWVPLWVDLGAVLTGDRFQQSVNVELANANQQLRVVAFWRERPYEPSER